MTAQWLCAACMTRFWRNRTGASRWHTWEILAPCYLAKGIRNNQIAQYYSNNIRLRDEKGDFLLIQYSESYDGSARVNIKHVELRVKKKGMEK